MLLLPASLGGGDELALPAQVTRCDAEGEGQRVVVRVGEIGAEAQRQLDALAAGAQIGTRVTPLLDVPARVSRSAGANAPERRPDPAAPTAPPAQGSRRDAERRKSKRVKREGRVLPLAGATDAADLVLTRDLSPDGASLVGLAGVAVGQRLTLALFGAAREEPVVVEARVVWEDEACVAVAFEALAPSQARQIQRLCGDHPCVESVDVTTGATRPVRVTRVTRLRVG
jgi:hypothetical protein